VTTPSAHASGRVLRTLHGDLELPVFLPDATRGVVRGLDADDLRACGIGALVVNAFHLQSHPGMNTLRALGGLHAFMHWPGPVMTDSGGFQVLSLLAGSSKRGSITKKGVRLRLRDGRDCRLLTPEKCIRHQFMAGADVLVCLDYCTHPAAPREEQHRSVDFTVLWAAACRQEFDRLVEATGRRPLLFAVVQGGNDASLRRECAERLLEIGFDGYGFGGWPVADGGRLVDMVQFVAGLIPQAHPRWGLGIGKPGNLVRAAQCGYSVFDCTIPTRDARHRRLYAFRSAPEDAPARPDDFCDVIYMQDDKHRRDARPVDETCDCPCCRNYSRAYLHHLFQVWDPLALRLATMHNLRFYARLMDGLRKATCVPPSIRRGGLGVDLPAT